MQEITVEKNPEGAYVITALLNDAYLLTRRYYGYTRREAVARFRAEMVDA